MTKLSSLVGVIILTAATAMPALAQQPAPAARAASTGGASAHETTSAVFDRARDNRVTISYGRPTAKGRPIWGGLVPWGKAWRLGSDEATLLLTQQSLQIGETTLAPGAYTLYLVPAESGPTKLAISKKLGGWGIPVDETADIARVDMTKEAIDNPVEALTIALVPNAAGGGTLRVSWEKTAFAVPFTIKK